ncbi:MAG: hypothetical protein NTV14_05870 [Coprothermobacterota bacterium]|nr:hypothetical protein [Coprothermobacterota bacterium]
MSQIKTMALGVILLALVGLLVFLILRPQTWIVATAGIVFLGVIAWAIITNRWPPPVKR